MQHKDPDEEGVIWRGMLVMLLVLVALLEFMAAGSKFLIGALRGTLETWVLSTLLLTLIGSCYLVLARGVWTLRSWVPVIAILLTLLVLAFSLMRLIQDPQLDLALVLVFFMAMMTNLCLLVWAFLPQNRLRLQSDMPQDALANRPAGGNG